jgi:hypothetical protein
LAFRCRPIFFSCFWSQLFIFNFTKYFSRAVKVKLWRFSCLSLVAVLFFKLAHNCGYTKIFVYPPK